ncbi:uncharacterized protein KY384_003954 [Bacidia gigantensis]|uniref:uncharacterized protein n=1 Tax=Bacidia gigantensis TaxID=2732470 RepID=UPI001D042633|nr:uncharacterized protein KY384_003954 [Bacidia gigantensis]KAG8532313.1 hypothetical protein KY384_003954 [Bacidia gigantensis]
MQSREAVAIAELVIYIPLLILATYVNIRQGFSRQLGYLYLMIFCILRLGGAALTIVAVNNPTSKTDAAWASVLGSIGLSPLLLAEMGMLDRICKSIEGRNWQVKILRLLHIPAIIGLIVGIVGGTKLQYPDKASTGLDYLKAGSILFLLTYLGVVAMAVLTLPAFPHFHRSEKAVFAAMLAALPFLAVRILYSLLASFVNNGSFSITKGNIFVQLGMAIIMELFTALFLIAAGLIAEPEKKRQQRQQPAANMGGSVVPPGEYEQHGYQKPLGQNNNYAMGTV